MEAPAGLGRFAEPVIQASGSFSDPGSRGAAAGALPVGKGYSLGAGVCYDGVDERTVLQLSACKVITGDPIGFMEGLYGPSITVGLSLRGDHSNGEGDYSGQVDGGLQFSVFPSFALGVSCLDAAGAAVFHTGFSHVFNRSLKVHLNYGDDQWQGGAELAVLQGFKVSAGTDGSRLSCGFSIQQRLWELDYGVSLGEHDMQHSVGMSWRFRR